MLLDTGGNGEDIGVEDDVLRVEIHFIDQDAISRSQISIFALKGVGLAFSSNAITTAAARHSA